MSTKQFNEKDCLACNPFEGDFGDSSDRVLSDKIVTARKPRRCSMCVQMVVAGQKIRSMSAVFDGQMHQYTWCSECCFAMAQSWTDDGIALEKRFKIGREVATTTMEAHP